MNANLLVVTALITAAFVVTACEAPDEGDENNCVACAADSAEETACIDAIRGCEETEDEDSAEEHEACEEAANANCE